MKLVTTRGSYEDVKYKARKSREDEIALFILTRILDPKKFSQNQMKYITENK